MTPKRWVTGAGGTFCTTPESSARPRTGRTLDTVRSFCIVRLRPAAAGREAMRLPKWMVRTNAVPTPMVFGGMIGLFWKVFAA